MKNELIRTISNDMSSYLNNYQQEILHNTLEYCLHNYDFIEISKGEKELINYLELFLSAKSVEGCSERTLNYYQTTIDNMLRNIGKNIKVIDTDDLRNYLTNYQKINNRYLFYTKCD